MIEIIALSKVFGARVALDSLTLTIPSGQSVAIVGPNGAGKTTLLRILATLTRPTTGSVLIDGLGIARDGEAVRGQVGFLSDRTLLYGDLTAEQNLRFYARLYQIDRPLDRVGSSLATVGLDSRRHDPVRTLSRGMQQRLALARALLHRPSLLLLDEPYSGLDRHAADTLTALLHEALAGGATLLHTTHDLRQALDLAHRVVVLARGRLAFDGSTADLHPADLIAAYGEAGGLPEAL